jgi:dCMP deaminase
MGRVSKIEMYKRILDAVASRSACSRRKLGALIVVDDRIVAAGYNGAPRGWENCGDEVPCYKDKYGIPSGVIDYSCPSVHAEMNAIINAAYHGVSIKGGTLYTQVDPCFWCALAIVNSGIKRVVVFADYSDKHGIEVLEKSGIEVVRAKIHSQAMQEVAYDG